MCLRYKEKIAAVLAVASVALTVALTASKAASQESYLLPHGEAAQIITVSATGQAAIEFNVLTQAIAVKETGPKQTVARFGEVYAFSPAFIAVRVDQPVRLTFWNLQPDDDHDFALMANNGESKPMMWVGLPALKKTSYVLIFHKPGLFRFLCLRHQPEMQG